MNDGRDIPQEASGFTTRTSVPLLFIKVFLLEGFFLLLYLGYLVLFGNINAPLQSGGIFSFIIWHFFEFSCAFYMLLDWLCLSYEINEKEIVLHKGIIAQDRRYYSLDKVESVHVNQSLMGRIFNYGEITLTLYYSDAPIKVCLSNVPRPRRCERILQKNLQDFGNRED